MAKVLGLPRLGIYSSGMKNFFEQMGCKVVMPPRVTQEIIKPGIMNSSDFMCYPYKVTLGQEIWNLQHGATDLIHFNTCGLCRFKHYHQLQEHTLRNLGYNFKMHALTIGTFVPKLMEITGASFEEVMKAMLPVPMQIEELEDRVYNKNNSSSLRIGIIGEWFTCIENDINFDTVDKLQKLGVRVHNSMTLSHFVEKAMKLDFFDRREEKAESWKLLSEEIGGHGRDSIYNTAYYGKLHFDGVIHLMPLSCMPESTVEPLVDYEAEKYGVAMYRFPIDENLFSVGFDTRLETFVGMLRRKKNAKDLSRH